MSELSLFDMTGTPHHVDPAAPQTALSEGAAPAWCDFEGTTDLGFVRK